MIVNIKILLQKTKNIKEEIEKTSDQESFASLKLKIEEYRKLQKSFQNDFFPKFPQDQTMTGAFVMRLCK